MGLESLHRLKSMHILALFSQHTITEALSFPFEVLEYYRALFLSQSFGIHCIQIVSQSGLRKDYCTTVLLYFMIKKKKKTAE